MVTSLIVMTRPFFWASAGAAMNSTAANANRQRGVTRIRVSLLLGVGRGRRGGGRGSGRGRFSGGGFRSVGFRRRCLQHGLLRLGLVMSSSVWVFVPPARSLFCKCRAPRSLFRRMHGGVHGTLSERGREAGCKTSRASRRRAAPFELALGFAPCPADGRRAEFRCAASVGSNARRLRAAGGALALPIPAIAARCSRVPQIRANASAFSRSSTPRTIPCSFMMSTQRGLRRCFCRAGVLGAVSVEDGLACSARDRRRRVVIKRERDIAGA